MKYLTILLTTICIIFSYGQSTWAVDLPHVFTNGEPASAMQVNENFNALKTAFESQEPIAFTGSYYPPFSSSGALSDRNVTVLRHYDEFYSVNHYYLWITFFNSEGFIIYSNGTPTLHNYIMMIASVDVESNGTLTYISTYIEGSTEEYGSNNIVEEAIYEYDDTTLVKKVQDDTLKVEYKCFNPGMQSVLQHCYWIYTRSADDSFVSISDNTRINSLLDEPITINGITFTDVRVESRLQQDRFFLLGKNVGRIVYKNSSGRTYKIIYYRINGTTEGGLSGTPFESGGALEGLFFTP